MRVKLQYLENNEININACRGDIYVKIKFFRSPYGKVVKQWLPPNKENRKFPLLYSLLFFQLGFLMQRAESKMKPFIVYHNYKTIIIFVIYSRLSDFHSHKNKVVMILASTNKTEKLKINKFLGIALRPK